VLGIPVKLCPAEETIWSKAFIMERERFDGADVAHLLHAQIERLDWTRLLARFGSHWRGLLSQLVLFGVRYPRERSPVPASPMRELIGGLDAELDVRAPRERVCQGTILSREQYLIDTAEWGYRDARLTPHGTLSRREVARWTAAINDDA